MPKMRFGLVVHDFEESSKEFMESDLEAVGLDPSDIYSVALKFPPPGIPDGWALAAYTIPYFTPEGELLEGMLRIRVKYREEITKAQLKQAGIGKYIGPTRAALIARNLTTTEPYLYPWRGTSSTVCICEGEKKAAKVSNEWKLRTIGIGGKDMWGERDDSRVVHTRIVSAIVDAEATRVVIIADPDIHTREDVRRSFTDFYFKLCGQLPGLTVTLVTPPTEGDVKIDDWLHLSSTNGDAGSIDDLAAVEGLELARGVETLTAEFDLIRKHTARGLGGLESNAYNAYQLIKSHPLLKNGWRYNEDSNMVEYNGHPHLAKDIGRVQGIMQRYLHLPTVSRAIVEEAVQREAWEHKYSPLHDEIMGIRWDGVDRLDSDYWGADKAAVIRATVCGYVKRIMQPGCFWRIMPIFTGPQGVGKTGFADWLAGGHGNVFDIHRGALAREDKDVTRRTMQPGIVRIDDLDSFGGAEIGRLKAMITATSAVLRVAYGREDRVYLRRGIMIATTNHKNIIPDDSTGNTRFAVVDVQEKFNFDQMHIDRLQILAQAWEMIKGGYEPTDIDFEAMKEYRETSPLRDKLDTFLDDIRDGTLKADDLTIWRTQHDKKECVAFKAERFWLIMGKDPTMYEAKTFKQLCIEYGLEHFAKDRKVRLGGKVAKNVYVLYF